MNIVLIGFKASGKTSTGKALSEKLKKQFIDTDQLIQKRFPEENNSISDIYKKQGEHAFRKIEKEAINPISDIDEAIIATGGGTVLDEENVKNLKRRGQFVYLDLSFEQLYPRIQKQGFPAFITQNQPWHDLEKLYSIRKIIYEALADIRINVDHQPTSLIVNNIIETVYGE